MDYTTTLPAGGLFYGTSGANSAACPVAGRRACPDRPDPGSVLPLCVAVPVPVVPVPAARRHTPLRQRVPARGGLVPAPPESPDLEPASPWRSPARSPLR